MFHDMLPVARNSSVTVEEHQKMTGGRRRILVIEDDSETVAQLVDELVTSGYDVDMAIDGHDGPERIASTPQNAQRYEHDCK